MNFTINRFLKIIENHQLSKSEPFSSFQDSKLGISGNLLLRKFQSQKQFDPCIGISQENLKSCFQKLKNSFDKYQIKFIIIFDGMQHRKQVERNNSKNQEFIKNTWTDIQKQNFQKGKESIIDWIKSYSIFGILDELKIEYITAPYSCYQQLKWMLTYYYVNALISDLQLLVYLYNFSHLICLIFDFDLDKEVFYWFNIKKLQECSYLSIDYIRELLLIDNCGMDFFKITQDKQQQQIDNYDILFQKMQKKENYKENLSQSQKTMLQEEINMLDTQMLFNSTCDVAHFTKSISDLPDSSFPLIGNQIPSTFYFFLTFNLLNIELANAFAYNTFYNKIPIGDSFEMHNFVDKQMKQHIIHAIAYCIKNISNPFKQKPYYYQKYFVKDKNEENIHQQILNMLIKGDIQLFQFDYSDQNEMCSFLKVMNHFTQSLQLNSPNKNNSRKGSENIQNQTQQQKTGSEEQNIQKERSGSEDQIILINKEIMQQKTQEDNSKFKIDQYPNTAAGILKIVKLNFLDCYQLININQKKTTLMTKSARKCNEAFDEEIIIFLYLIQSPQSNLLFKQFSSKGGTDQQDQIILSPNSINEIQLLKPNLTNAQKESIIMISRIFSFIPIRYEKQWNGKYDYNSIQFLSLIQQIQFMMRCTFESMLVGLYIQMYQRQLISQFSSCRTFLPFRKIYNCGLAIIMIDLLQGTQTLQDLQQLDIFTNLKEDISRGLAFWEEIIKIITYQFNSPYSDSNVSKVYKKYMEADKYLKSQINMKEFL